MSCGVTVESLLGILFPGVWVGLFKMAHNRENECDDVIVTKFLKILFIGT